MKALETRIEAVERRLVKYEQNQEKIMEMVSEIHTDLTKYRGFVGGVLFVASAIGTALTFIFNYKAG